MLDFDGTLAPLTARRGEARPRRGSLAHLRAIARRGDTRIAIVSGRRLTDLERLLDLDSVTLVAEHGWEERPPGGRRVRHRLRAGTRTELLRAERAARARGWGPYLERKRSALVLHTRRLPEHTAADLEAEAAAAWSTATAGGTLALEPIHGGLELRAVGRNKGTAARALIASAPADALAVFVGDDLADEDAFEAVRPRGFGLLVAARARPTAAQARLAGPAAVSGFLARWRRATRG